MMAAAVMSRVTIIAEMLMPQQVGITPHRHAAHLVSPTLQSNMSARVFSPFRLEFMGRR